MEVGIDAIAGDFYAQCRNGRTCSYDGCYASSAEDLVASVSQAAPLDNSPTVGSYVTSPVYGNCRVLCVLGDEVKLRNIFSNRVYIAKLSTLEVAS